MNVFVCWPILLVTLVKINVGIPHNIDLNILNLYIDLNVKNHKPALIIAQYL